MGYDQIVPLLEQELREWYRQSDIPPSASIESTIRTNTSLVRKRAEIVLGALTKFGANVHLEESRVLDAGCGFGALSFYMLLEKDLAFVLALDNDEHILTVGPQVVEKLGLSNIRFAVGDIGELPCQDSDFDFVVCNNVLNFVPRHRLRKVFSEFFRVLKVGGRVVLYAPNRLHYIEPFLKVPLVQFLPQFVANAYMRRTGKGTSYRRADEISSLNAVRLLRKVGFSGVTVIDPYAMNADSWHRFLKPYFCLVATKHS